MLRDDTSGSHDRGESSSSSLSRRKGENLAFAVQSYEKYEQNREDIAKEKAPSLKKLIFTKIEQEQVK